LPTQQAKLDQHLAGLSAINAQFTGPEKTARDQSLARNYLFTLLRVNNVVALQSLSHRTMSIGSAVHCLLLLFSASLPASRESYTMMSLETSQTPG